jgi:hypothetical protein
MKYVIVKSSRSGSNRTYTGVTWNNAGLKIHIEGALYNDFIEANELAKELSKHNPVGFTVEEYKEPGKILPENS